MTQDKIIEELAWAITCSWIYAINVNETLRISAGDLNVTLTKELIIKAEALAEKNWNQVPALR